MRRLVLVCLIFILLVGCSKKMEKTELANPASVHCEEQGGKLEIRDNEAGQVGYCLFDDGSECEEWAYFRGECRQ